MAVSQDHEPSITAVTSGQSHTPGVDLSAIKPGDTVLLRALVYAIGDPNWAVRIDHCRESATQYVHPRSIVFHKAALQVGDRVRNARAASSPPGYAGGEVLGIADRWAIVLFPGSSQPGAVPLSDLERLPDEPAIALAESR